MSGYSLFAAGENLTHSTALFSKKYFQVYFIQDLLFLCHFEFILFVISLTPLHTSKSMLLSGTDLAKVNTDYVLIRHEPV